MKRIPLVISLAAISLAVCASLVIFSKGKVDWSKTPEIIDVIKNAATILALGIGAAWAYFNFFRGRTYRPRLEPHISGKVFIVKEVPYLSIIAQLTNVGLSDVDIQRKGTAISVYLYKASFPVSKVQEVPHEPLAAFDVFELHPWIEPGELIKDERMIVIPKGEWVGVRLEIRIVSRGIEWNAASVLEHPIISTTKAEPQLGLAEKSARPLTLQEKGQ